MPQQQEQPLLSLPWQHWVRAGSRLKRLVPASEQLRLLECVLLDRTGLRGQRGDEGVGSDSGKAAAAAAAVAASASLVVDSEDADDPLCRDFVRARLLLRHAASATYVAAADLCQVESYVVRVYETPPPSSDSGGVTADHLARLFTDRCAELGVSVLASDDPTETADTAGVSCVLRVTADVQSVLRCASGYLLRCGTAGDGCGGRCPAVQLLRSIIESWEKGKEVPQADFLVLRYCDKRRVVELFSPPPPQVAAATESPDVPPQSVAI